MSKSGALFDISKFNDVSKNIIAAMNCDTIYKLYLNWAKEYDTTIANILIEHEYYAKKIFNIERENEKPRKDFVKWLDVKEHIEYFFDDFYKNSISDSYNSPSHIPMDEVMQVMGEKRVLERLSQDFIWEIKGSPPFIAVGEFSL